LKNERGEWDLPGGKLQSDISAEACLIREVKEETNLDISVGSLEATFIYNIQNWIKVFVVVYQCSIISDKNDLEISGEHYDKSFFNISEIKDINIYVEYQKIIQRIFNKK
jgi:8-oxo-dGTP pyrophosphatase MutT (NUDIX family)